MQAFTSTSVPCNVGTHALIKVGYCGGFGGSPRDMDDITSIARIVQIGIRHGQAIDAITIRFERNGYEESTGIWGGTGGSPVLVDFQPTEYITAVKGHAGELGQNYIVKSLRLETNLSTYGPYGEEKGNPFELSVGGGQIIGFFARSGYYVYAIGVYVKVLTAIPHNVRSPAIKKFGQCGGSGGTSRNMDVTGVTRIVKIGIRHSQVIDALIVRFERNGLQENTNLWGGRGGKLKVINFQPNEHITTVKGYTDFYNNCYVLTSLTLETNLGTYGPFGSNTGSPFELSALGGQIIGFYARSGLWLDAIGVYVMPLTGIPSNMTHPVRKIGLCGGGGGQVRDMDVSDVTRISKIDIRDGNFIIALVVHFERNDREESTDPWGRQDIGDLKTIYFQPMEYIMSIKGYLDYLAGNFFVLRSLKLETNLRTHGPYGIERGTPFELSALDGQKIIGLHARSGDVIDAIGVYVKDV